MKGSNASDFCDILEERRRKKRERVRKKIRKKRNILEMARNGMQFQHKIVAIHIRNCSLFLLLSFGRERSIHSLKKRFSSFTTFERKTYHVKLPNASDTLKNDTLKCVDVILVVKPKWKRVRLSFLPSIQFFPLTSISCLSRSTNSLLRLQN